jgi:hypothetical protein
MAERKNQEQQDEQEQFGQTQQQLPAVAAAAGPAAVSRPAAPDTISSSNHASSSSASGRDTIDNTTSSSCDIPDLVEHPELRRCFALLKDAEGDIPDELIQQLQLYFHAYLHQHNVHWGAWLLNSKYKQATQHGKGSSSSTSSSSSSSSRQSHSSTAVLNQLETELQSGVAAAAVKLHNSKAAQQLNNLVVPAVMQAVRALAQTGQLFASIQSSFHLNKLVTAQAEQSFSHALPALCDAAREAVSAVVAHYVSVDNATMLQQPGGEHCPPVLKKNSLQKDGQADVRMNAATSSRQAHSLIDACAASTAAAGTASAASKDDALAKASFRHQVRAKFSSGFTAEYYPTSLVGAKQLV